MNSLLPAAVLFGESDEIFGVVAGCIPLLELYPPQPKLNSTRNNVNKSFMITLRVLV
jgi:hypothetical protein